MNRDIAAKWIAALRSDDYKQATGTLAQEDYSGTTTRYCCLGVLCELAVIEGVIPSKEKTGISLSYCYGDSDGSLPDRVRDWAEMKTADGAFEGRAGSLVVFNDEEGYSFQAIASVIEENVDEL